ncbi:DapH/DapD/GlmU-related protein [Undibacterium sp. RuRC25W]|uniref:DapH/DapD/GlmU-related protein n=1 Tax=Undibacterium sp. RuRC25W TaxID=3413047 RepID=UPI003BEF6CA3
MRLPSTPRAFFIQKPLSLIGLRYLEVGDNFCCGFHARIEVFDRHNASKFNPRVRIGRNVSINDRVHIAAINSIEIGNDVLIASDVYISDHSHGDTLELRCALPPSSRQLVSKGPVKIADKVWIGEKVSILPGVQIGEGAIVGAGSVVTRNVPPYTIVAGVPAREINNKNNL